MEYNLFAFKVFLAIIYMFESITAFMFGPFFLRLSKLDSFRLSC